MSFSLFSLDFKQKNAGGDSFNEFFMQISHHFYVKFVCVAESDHTYHQKNIGGSTQATCIVYPLSLLPLFKR